MQTCLHPKLCRFVFTVLCLIVSVLSAHSQQCPGNIQVNNTPGTCGARINYQLPQPAVTTAESNTFTYTGSIVYWTVPASVTSINIEAKGAAGGATDGNGGQGAIMKGTFNVIPGSILKILVGGKGRVNSGGAGGGGGTFVTSVSNEPIIVAGGGGGVSGIPSPAIGVDANITTNGNNGNSSEVFESNLFGIGGVNGNGATNPVNAKPGGGNGGGLNTNGDPSRFATFNASSNYSGFGFVNGGGGGLAGRCSSSEIKSLGGFGGAGGGDCYGAGGGGGYSGGGGSSHFPSNGGGGGSYNSGTNQVNSIGNEADGSVIISWGSTPSTVQQITGLTSGSEFPVGTTLNTFQFTNSDGTVSNCSFSVTITDTEAPLLNGVPSDLTVNVGQLPQPAVVTASDNCSNSLPVNYIEQIQNGNCAGSYTITRTWTAADASGNQAIASQVISVTDNIPPVITTAVGSLDRIVDCADATALNAAKNLLPFASDNSGVVSIITNPDVVTSTCGSSYILQRSWEFTDACGNTSGSFVQLITVKDQSAPSFTAPVNAMISMSASCSYDASPAITGDVINESDNCSQGLQASFSDLLVRGGTSTLIQRTWHLEDECGNAAPDQVQVITLTDYNVGYVVFAKSTAIFGQKNIINGSVGVSSSAGSAVFMNTTELRDPNFVKAASIFVSSTAIVPTRILMAATDGPNEIFYPFSGNTTALENFTSSGSSIVPVAGNYKNVTIKKNTNLILSGNLFGKIDIEEGATITFDVADGVLNIENLNIKGKAGTTTIIKFARSTSIRVRNRIDIWENVQVNPGGPKVVFYLGHNDINEEKFILRGGNNLITANVYVPDGTIKVTGSENSSTVLTGWFIAEKVISDGKNIVWNKAGCDEIQIHTLTNQKSDAESVVTSTLKVTVMPNPTTSIFRIKVESRRTELVQIIVTDNSGRIVSNLKNIQTGAITTFGNQLPTGHYFAKIIQGKVSKTVRLIKIK